MYCSDIVTSDLLNNIICFFATSNKIRILPFMFNQESHLKVICPCCILDRRVDNDGLSKLKDRDRWSSCFVKQKFRKHYMEFDKNTEVLQPGLAARSVDESSRRTKYDNIDYPIFKEMGFKGHRFDKNVFFPLAVCRTENGIRAGIPNPDLLSPWPILEKAAASWIFRLIDVPPIEMPDVLPISSIGSLYLSENDAAKSFQSCGKSIEVGNFFNVLNKRADKRALKKLDDIVNFSKVESGRKNTDNARRTNDITIDG